MQWERSGVLGGPQHLLVGIVAAAHARLVSMPRVRDEEIVQWNVLVVDACEQETKSRPREGKHVAGGLTL